MAYRKAQGFGILALLALGLSACTWNSDSNDSVPGMALADIAGQEFDRVTLAGPDNVEVVMGSATSVAVSGDSDAIEKLRFRVENGVLRIDRHQRSGVSWSSGLADVTVTMPALREFKLAGSGDANIARLSGDEVELAVAGSGTITVAEVATRKLSGKMAGSGTLSLAGTSETADFAIAGSGNIAAAGLTVDKADISIAGSGDMEFTSDGEVEARIMGSGNVRVNGSARCTTKAMGSGTLNCG